MWAVQYSKNLPAILITNRYPKLIETDLFREEFVWDTTNSYVYIARDVRLYLPGISFEKPIEVIPYIDDENPMFYCQRHKNLDSSEDLYMSDHKSWRIIYEYDKGIFGIPLKKPKKYYYIDTYSGHRLPRKLFPEITIDSGVIGISVAVKSLGIILK